jgi:hypothetical protein
MSSRRLFWLGEAVLFSVAALVAIAAVLSGSFGPTQEHILETCAVAFVCGGAVLAGLACIDRGVFLGVATFASGSSRAQLGSGDGLVLGERSSQN